jgi:hypothetical protein
MVAAMERRIEKRVHILLQQEQQFKALTDYN